MPLSTSQRFLLEKIQQKDGQWNWYQLGRWALPRLESPADFNLKPLRESGFIKEVPIDGEPLPRLWITAVGRRELKRSQAPITHPFLLFGLVCVLVTAGTFLAGVELEWFMPNTHVVWDGQRGAVFHESVRIPLGRQFQIDFRGGQHKPAHWRITSDRTGNVEKHANEIIELLKRHSKEFDTIVMDGGKWIDRELYEIQPQVEEWAKQHAKHVVHIYHTGLCFDRPCEEAFLIR